MNEQTAYSQTEKEKRKITEKKESLKEIFRKKGKNEKSNENGYSSLKTNTEFQTQILNTEMSEWMSIYSLTSELKVENRDIAEVRGKGTPDTEKLVIKGGPTAPRIVFGVFSLIF